MDLMRQLELEQMKTEIPDFGVGDTVNVHYLIKEGDKERIQVFTGTVIAIRGSGIRRSVVVRRLVAGQGVERVFPLHSPRIQDISVVHTGKVRRAKLYYLRDRVGKAVRLRANFGKRRGPVSGKGSGLSPAADTPEEAPAAEAPSEEPANAGAEEK